MRSRHFYQPSLRELTVNELALLLHKSHNESRDQQRQYLTQLGGEGTVRELDYHLSIAANNADAVGEAARLDQALDRESNLAANRLYQLAEASPPSHPDLAIVAAKVPEGVICLISALSFHELTTQIPHEVYLAIRRNSEPPRINYPPVRTFRFSGKAFTEGVETHDIGPVAVRVYCREKTLADCFKYRNKIGLDTCLEALQTFRQQRGFNADVILKYATICRVAKVIRPYIEAIL